MACATSLSREAVERMGDFVCVIDRAGIVVYANPASRRGAACCRASCDPGGQVAAGLFSYVVGGVGQGA
jgi:hypothetical protein